MKVYKNSDATIITDEFNRLKSSLTVLSKEHPDLIELLKPHYFPEHFPSEIIELAKINTNNDKSTVKREVNKVANELKTNITLMTMLEKANHIIAVKNTIDFDFNIYQDKHNEPRFHAENTAIKEFLRESPDQTSLNYQYIKSAYYAAEMLFHFVRSVNDLQKFQKENNNLEPEKLPHDKLEQLTKILNRVAQSFKEMKYHDNELRKLIAQQPRQEIVSRLAPPSINESIQQRKDTLPSTQQLATKPILRMVEKVLHETLTKLENAVKDNNKTVFDQCVTDIIKSSSQDQIRMALKSLEHLNIRITKLPEKNLDSTKAEKLSMLKEGISSLNKASKMLLAPSPEDQPAPSISKRF